MQCLEQILTLVTCMTVPKALTAEDNGFQPLATWILLQKANRVSYS